jgi:hypothetical protein
MKPELAAANRKAHATADRNHALNRNGDWRFFAEPNGAGLLLFRNCTCIRRATTQQSSEALVPDADQALCTPCAAVIRVLAGGAKDKR